MTNCAPSPRSDAVTPRLRLLALLTIVTGLTAAERARPAGDRRAAPPAGVQRVSNIEYSNPGSGALLLDLYIPATPPAQPRPVVLWIHGGGWKSGGKDNCPLSWLAGEGYAVVSLG